MASGSNQSGLVANLTSSSPTLQGRYSPTSNAATNQAMQNTGDVQVLPEALSNALSSSPSRTPTSSTSTPPAASSSSRAT